MGYQYQEFPFVVPPGLKSPEPRHKVVIVGAGPIGLAMAIDLAQRGIASTVLDDNNVVSLGSRAICWAKRTLEIFDRLGIGERMVSKGVTWNVGRTHHRAREVFNFDLLPEDGHKMPAFINLQQYYVEQFLVERAQELPDLIDLRFCNKVTAHRDLGDHVEINIETPAGTYSIQTEYMLACDGAGSPTRDRMGLEFDGELFEERFLIADIVMEADFPSERWFWFEPEFHPGQSALLHKQPDNIYRIDLQLGWDADPNEEKKPENVIPRIQKVVEGRAFELDWVSVYTFQCRRLAEFVHGRVLFVGDSAHVVSPFGARGGNGGVQDVDNLGWKLSAVLNGEAPESLLQTYNDERVMGADENIRNSARATKFMSPEEGPERIYRDAVLNLASDLPFASGMVNSGRLSLPCVYDGMPLNGADDPMLPPVTRPGAVAIDAPLEDGWLLNKLGQGITLLAIGCKVPELDGTTVIELEADQILRERYLGEAEEAIYVLRPDGVVAARWQEASLAEISHAIERIMGQA